MIFVINDIVVAFQSFIMQMSNHENAIDKKVVSAAISDICRLSDVGMMTIDVHSDFSIFDSEENLSDVIYQDGETDDDVITIKKITDGTSVLLYKVYHKKGAPAWTERIRNRLDLMISMLYLFSSRFEDEAGYHNLRYFSTQLVKLCEDAGLKGYAAARFNLKHFQAVNHQVGRDYGDVVMHTFIAGLDEISDAPIPVCRIGGDNFIMLMTAEKIKEVVEYLKGTVVSFGDEFSDRVNVSATAGVYILDDDFELNIFGEIMDKLSLALSAAKTSGRDDIIFFEPKLMEEKKHIATVQHQLPEAMEKEEFHVYYQPKVSIIDGKIVGAEALCRWKHDGELIYPIGFVPILERSMDICKLDFYMLEHVCRDLRRWIDEGRDIVRISVNLSRKHILDIDLVRHLLHIIDLYGVPHEYIEIELTETTTDVEFKDMKYVVSCLQEQGISTSVDDFGIGYSSLNLIKEIPWDVLKIDKSIVPVDEDDERSPRSVMFKYVVAMAREMGLECIAEGVETAKQLEALRKYGCCVAQGFYYDKALPVEVFEKRLEEGTIIR